MQRIAVHCTLFIVFISIIFIRKNNNNVCKTFEDYYSDRDNNENCYYNPDIDLDLPDIVKRHGYPIEFYNITTDDGYILTLFRIPYGKKNITATTSKKPIFLQHGMTLNSGSYINTGNKSLGFILADSGYDVWLGNFRGAYYARNHIHLKESDEKFWDFSFHENGIYDLPAQLNFVNSVTKQKIIFIGYSLGSTAAYVYGTLYSKTAQEKVKIFINFAPSIFMEDIGPFFNFFKSFWPIVEPFVQTLTNGKLFIRQPWPVTVTKLLCFPFPFQMKMCQFFEMLALGFNFEQNDPETLPVTLLQNSDTSSVKTVTHLWQVGNSGKFQFFDYGTEVNKKMYGNIEPLTYNLTNVKVPSYTILGENDLGVRKEGIHKLYRYLPKQTTVHGIYFVKHKRFNHLNFISAKDIKPLLYDHILTFLNKL